MQLIPVTKEGQIDVFDTILVKDGSWAIRSFKVRGILNENGKEEILLIKRSNQYFITQVFLDGKSWVKECYIVK